MATTSQLHRAATVQHLTDHNLTESRIIRMFLQAYLQVYYHMAQTARRLMEYHTTPLFPRPRLQASFLTAQLAPHPPRTLVRLTFMAQTPAATSLLRSG
jgi:uncharacterized membrane-anchored protein YhcB (DUF1043 family)